MNQTRFSLNLLEPDEIYFEDYMVYYNNTAFPSIERKNGQQTSQKGMLKICSKSFVFEPFDLKFPVIKFQYKFIDEDFINNKEEHEKICFAIKSKQFIQLKENNVIKPYQIVRFNEYKTFYFQLIFTNVFDSMHLMKQLYRANTLDIENEELMVSSIVKSFIIRIKFDLTQLEDVYNEQILFECEIHKINALVKNPGKLFLTNKCIYYKSINNIENCQKFLKIKLNSIQNIFKRRFKLRKNIACEILLDSSAYQDSLAKNSLSYLYLLFENESKCIEFYEELKKLVQTDDLNDKYMLQKWRHGLISNYEYLMYLNSSSDRSFNDLTQYPIFPWVLNDYKSKHIDLNDQRIYRDLSKPIGALNENRLKRLKTRLNEFKNEEHKWLYGTHYSTPAFVLFYLIREHPEWQLCLQNGRFDQPDRIFHSIYDTWSNCLSLDTDFKELIPQFYDTSNDSGSFLLNLKNVDFGRRQDGSFVDNVSLPDWCHTQNVKQFIHVLRDALESSYVSSNLHLWIDLIFGFKQCGQNALESDNLFYYLCYEGGIKQDNIINGNERKSIERQILEFGQVPTQLFNVPHPSKAELNPRDDMKHLNFEKIYEYKLDKDIGNSQLSKN
jgi:factor associated with neutral sphingomyelinase activation